MPTCIFCFSCVFHHLWVHASLCTVYVFYVIFSVFLTITNLSSGNLSIQHLPSLSYYHLIFEFFGKLMSLNGTCLKWLTVINLFYLKNYVLNISKFMKVPLLAVYQHSGIGKFSMQHFVLV